MQPRHRSSPMRLPILLAITATLAAQTRPLPKLTVSPNHRFLQTADGKPFFYLADTAWELFHRLDRKQAADYLSLRASQGYTAIQAVALAELDGIVDPNAYGDLPLTDGNPAQPAITPGTNPNDKTAYDYWDHVDYIVEQANARGLYVALLPSWGRWVNGGRNDESQFSPPQMPRRMASSSASAMAKKGIIWVLGGDRTPTGFEDTWRAMAKGIAIGVSGKEDYSSAR